MKPGVPQLSAEKSEQVCEPGDGLQEVFRPGFQASSRLVHGWDSFKNVHVYSLVGLSTHQNVKC